MCCSIKNQSKLKIYIIFYFVIHNKIFYKKHKNTKIRTNLDKWVGYLKSNNVLTIAK